MRHQSPHFVDHCHKRVCSIVNNVANIFESCNSQLPTSQQNNISASQIENNVDFGREEVKSQTKSTPEAYLQDMF